MDIIREKILKNWIDFLKKSNKTRERIENDFKKAITKLDHTVAEQRQATILLLKKALKLNDGDVVQLKSDGTYIIIRCASENE